MRTRVIGEPSTAASPGNVSEPTALLLGGVVLAAVAGAVFILAAGNSGFGVFLSCLMGFAASTMWLIGCVAIGVRMGMARD